MPKLVLSGEQWALIAVAVAFLLGIAVRSAWSLLRRNSGYMAGKWAQIIYDVNGIVVKRDLVTSFHSRDSVYGKIKRMYPPRENFKRWRFSGKLDGGLFYTTFWTTDLKKNPGSYGTILLHKITESHFEGFYIRLTVTGEGASFHEELTSVRLEWKRILHGTEAELLGE